MNVQRPKISIITVTFRSEKTISKTIESVLNQTYTNIEYIIIDGASTDKTIEIIKVYEKYFADKKIAYRWISEPDNGISDAFNKGIKYASGDIIGIINSDDWLENDAVETIVKNLDFDHSIYCGHLNIFDSKLKFLKKRKSRPILLPLGMYINHPTVFVKREVYFNIKFDTNLRITMDYDFLLKSWNEGFKIKRIDKVIANMLQGGISWDLNKMRVEEKLVMRNNLPYYLYFLARIKLNIEDIIVSLYKSIK